MTTNIFFAHLLPEQHLYDDDDRKYSLMIGQRKKVPEIGQKLSVELKIDGLCQLENWIDFFLIFNIKCKK